MTILIISRFNLTAHISRSFLFADMVGRNRIKVDVFMNKYTCTTVFMLMPTKFGTKFIVFNCPYVNFKIFEVVLGYTYYMRELRV